MRAVFPLVALLALLPARAAHAPEIEIGVGSQAVLTIGRSEAEIGFQVEYSGLQALEVMRRFDVDGDGRLGEEERKSLVSYVKDAASEGTALFLDGQEIRPSSVTLEGDEGLPTGPIGADRFGPWWKLTYSLPPLEPEKLCTLTFRDETHEGRVARQVFWLPLDRQGVGSARVSYPEASRVEIVQGAARVIDHRKVVVEFTAAGPGGPGGEPERAGAEGIEPFRPVFPALDHHEEAGDFGRTFDRALSGPWGMAIALLICAFWGAAHALGPGHGKSMVAAYLVGTRGRVRDAVILGAAATVAHTLSIFLIGAVLIWVFYETMSRSYAVVQTWVSLGAGLTVAGIGLLLLWRRGRGLRRARDREAHEHTHHHPPKQVADEEGRLRLGGLISLGFSGGVIPCTSGLALIILAFTRRQPVLGMILLVAFSAGLGIVLVSVGVAMVLGKSAISKRTSRRRWEWLIQRLPIASAALVSLVGLVICYQAILEGIHKGVFG